MACCFALWFLVLCWSCLFKTVQSQETHVIAENGQRKVLTCTLPSSATSVTWQLLRDSGYVNVSTCVPNSCTDHLSSLFKGNIASSTDGYTSTLEIYSVTKSDTEFICLTDTGDLAANITLDVYVTPSTPSCRISWKFSPDSYIDVICKTDNIYPSFQATLHRRELDRYNLDENATRCTMYKFDTETTGNYHGDCTWRIPFSSLRETNTFFVVIETLVWNDTLAGSPVFSSDISATISLPSLVINNKNCPVGPGVIGEYIKIGTVATCQCDLVSSGDVSGRVRWYTHDGDLVTTQVTSRQSTILSFSYNASDTNQTYDCRADNPTLTYYHILYTPTFSTSPPQSLISGLLLVMGISLALKLA